MKYLKFTLFTIQFDFTWLPIGIFGFTGAMIIGMSFIIDKMGWWIIPYLLFSAAWLACAESVFAKYDAYKAVGKEG